MSLMMLQYFRWEVVFYLDSASTIHIHFAFLKIKAIVHNSTDDPLPRGNYFIKQFLLLVFLIIKKYPSTSWCIILLKV